MLTSTTILAILLGGLIGLSLGMLGGGGSILTVPALVYVLGQDPHAAISASLVIVGLNALTGAWFHRRAGHVHLKSAMAFGGMGLLAGGLPGLLLGTRMASRLPVQRLRQGFAMLVIVLGTTLLAINVPKLIA